MKERRYRLGEKLGEGGFGTVWRGQVEGESGFVKSVAIKLLSDEGQRNPEVAGRLRDEARILARLRHRAIVGVDDLVRIDGRWAVVMELVDGADLRRVLEAGPVPARCVAEIGREIAAALRAAHEATDPVGGGNLGVVHRDIKPANAILTPAGEVKVLDFGVARAQFADREARTRSVGYGSEGYISPERYDGIDSPAADVYALGVLLLECLSGRRVPQLSVNPAAHARGLDEVLAGLPEAAAPVEGLLRRMLAYESAERPTAGEVARELQERAAQLEGPWLADWAPPVVAAVGPRPGEGRPPSAPSLVTRRAPDRRRLWIGAGAVAVGLFGGLGLLGLGVGILAWSLGERGGEAPVGAAGPAEVAEPVEAAAPVEVAEGVEAAEPVEAAAPVEVAEGTVAPAEPVGAEPAPADPGPTPTPSPRAGGSGGAASGRSGGSSGGAGTSAAVAARSRPEPRPAAALGSFVVKGDAVEVRLVDADGARHGPGLVPAGSYGLEASFATGVRIRREATLRVVGGETLTVSCSSVQETCR